jgi:hypothetical protein
MSRNHFIPEEYFISFVASRREYSGSVDSATLDGTAATAGLWPRLQTVAADNSLRQSERATPGEQRKHRQQDHRNPTHGGIL